MTQDRFRLHDPRTEYPQPHFQQQLQAVPRLAALIKPRPDHGAESYQGFGRLLERKALITRGNSGSGRAVAIAFARERADVAFGYLPSEERDPQDAVCLIKEIGR